MARKPKTVEQKLDYIMSRLEDIDRAVHPPFYKSLISWIFSNLWTFIFLAIIGYVLWQVWEIVQAIQTSLDAVNQQINGVKTSISDQFSTVKETLAPFQNVRFDQWKFWE